MRTNFSLLVAEVVPLKQGLKQPVYIFIANYYFYVAEVVPLKQGLKPSYASYNTYIDVYVAEVVPLKQGLKPVSPVSKLSSAPSCRGSSIKTRIETNE